MCRRRPASGEPLGDGVRGGSINPKTSETSETYIYLLLFYRGLAGRGCVLASATHPRHPRQLRLRGLLWAAWRRQSRAQHQRQVASVARASKRALLAQQHAASKAGVAIYAERIVRIFRQQGVAPFVLYYSRDCRRAGRGMPAPTGGGYPPRKVPQVSKPKCF